jgi:hypothetical protein
MIFCLSLFSLRLFELAVDGISLWQQRNPTIAREWRIISIGEDYSLDAVSQLNNFKNLGKLGLEDYSSYLRTAYVGISLMVSPHTSYPPLEMAEAGFVTITNSCFGKDLGRVANNIISLERVTEDAIADAIATAILRANVSPETVDVAGANSVHSSSRSRSVRTGGTFGEGRDFSTACSTGRSQARRPRCMFIMPENSAGF